MKELNISGSHIDTIYFTPNRMWALQKWETYNNNVKSDSFTFAEVSFILHFQRKSLYYVINQILPLALITLLMIMTFVLPPNARAAPAITLMLASTIFMLLAGQTIPETSESTTVSRMFFLFCRVLIFIIVVALFVVSRLYNRKRTDLPMGVWTRIYIFDKLSTVIIG